MRDAVGPRLPLQGNLDPLLMVLGGDRLVARCRQIVDQMAGTPFVFNLGHGITPDADPENVAILVDAVRSNVR